MVSVCRFIISITKGDLQNGFWSHGSVRFYCEMVVTVHNPFSHDLYLSPFIVTFAKMIHTQYLVPSIQEGTMTDCNMSCISVLLPVSCLKFLLPRA